MKAKHLTVDHLWQCERIGTPSISPDGKWVVVDQTTYSMETNECHPALALLHRWQDAQTAHQRRQEEHRAAMVARRQADRLLRQTRRRQDADEEPQLYVIAPDGGEGAVTSLSTGVGSIKVVPDSKRVAAISWVCPS